MENVKVKLSNQNGVYLTYILKHVKNYSINEYKIEAKICGVEDLKEDALFIFGLNSECLNISNEETLMEEFAIELLEKELQTKK
jgi:hypothetical protein